jgi:ribosomal protein S3
MRAKDGPGPGAERLRKLGVSGAQIERLRATIRLSIHARTPNEIALGHLGPERRRAQQQASFFYWRTAWVIATPLMKPM